MHRFTFTLLLIAALGIGETAQAACELAKAKTTDGKVEVVLRLATSGCNAGKEERASPLATGDAVATKILVDQAEIAGIELRRDDGLAAVTPAEIRELSPGTYFSNLDFAAPGTWVVFLKVQRPRQSETVEVRLPVVLNGERAAAAVANPAKAPAFSLQNLDGKTVTQKDLEGKVWVANFFFASCPEVCPLMARHLAELQRTFKGDPDFRIVSVTTDPRTDTPEILKAFAKRHGADPRHWLVLRGTKDQAVALSTGGLNLDVKADSNMHSMRFAVVGKDGTVRARYDSTKLDEREQLKTEVRALLAQ